ncbi:PLP-dependent aminotransferase family protein [Bryobacter aggregatus]|uniref:aminotransferase-like domain-containing protein n=1 Tax=Bryobacter aggregatus TaxID=360054 RepID=UPI00068DF898|nr:PLP-dependent aminotransferase family protein [Bryobacter aggregatus]
MIQLPPIDGQSDIPVYRQLYAALKSSILAGDLQHGDRLPPTRDLAQQLNLNRATVSAAYALLEEDGLVNGQVGRGSFVQNKATEDGEISFATSRPSTDLFPVNEFQATAQEVLSRDLLKILQLGSPHGYAPLRNFLIEEAIAEGVFHPDRDDLLITSGCQQALDLIQKALIPAGAAVLTSEPIYPGLRNAFSQSVTVDPSAPRIEARIVTPSFHNPTGETMTLAERSQLAASPELLIEVDIYSRLRYTGDALPTIRSLSTSNQTLLLRSFSKIAFPGLRVGWVIGAKPLIQKLALAKQWTDLHSDQLSQAIMLEFARSGRLQQHLGNVLEAGRIRLQTTIKTLEQVLPQGSTFTRPEGGMNLWVTLPRGCDTASMLEKARRVDVNYLPGRYFSLSAPMNESFRLSFAGLSPQQITEGLRRLAPLFEEEARIASRYQEPLPAMAMV